MAFPSNDISNLVFNFLLYFSRNKTEGIRVERGRGGCKKEEKEGVQTGLLTNLNGWQRLIML